jgi:hypothetical protein
MAGRPRNYSANTAAGPRSSRAATADPATTSHPHRSTRGCSSRMDLTRISSYDIGMAIERCCDLVWWSAGRGLEGTPGRPWFFDIGKRREETTARPTGGPLTSILSPKGRGDDKGVAGERVNLRPRTQPGRLPIRGGKWTMRGGLPNEPNSVQAGVEKLWKRTQKRSQLPQATATTQGPGLRKVSRCASSLWTMC